MKKIVTKQWKIGRVKNENHDEDDYDDGDGHVDGRKLRMKTSNENRK